jgi:DNA repair photolyase
MIKPPAMQLLATEVRQILTRTGGYLSGIASHSLQPYRGCALGNSLCGVGCYVRHNIYVTRGRAWGSFVEQRLAAASAYLATVGRERAWAQKHRGRFCIFMSSSTEPFQPIERRAGITRQLLEAMMGPHAAPDELIIQTHSHRVMDYLELYRELNRATSLRFHVTIESDRDSLPGLPPSASTVSRRFAAAAALRDAGLRVVITVAPLIISSAATAHRAATAPARVEHRCPKRWQPSIRTAQLWPIAMRWFDWPVRSCQAGWGLAGLVLAARCSRPQPRCR